MRGELFSLIGQAVEQPDRGSVLAEALRISAVGLLSIFIVMGLFAVLIKLFARLFPKPEGETEQ